MLVLTRRLGDSVMVGDDVKVTVLGFGGGQQVKLGVEAPAGVIVHRKEIWDRIRAGEHDRQLRRADEPARPRRSELTRGQLEWLMRCETGDPAWWNDRVLFERWEDESGALAELAAEVLELRLKVATLERRAS